MGRFNPLVTSIVGITGQSNAVMFRSDPADLPTSTKDADIIMTGNAPGNFTTSTSSVTYLRQQLVSDGGGNGFIDVGITIPAGFSSWGYGVEMMLARGLHNNNRQIAVVKRSVGSTALGNVGANPYYHNVQSPALAEGFNITNFVDYVTGLRAHITGLGRIPRMLLIYDNQGEDDATDLTASTEYAYHKSRQIKFLRAKLGENVAFILALTTTGGSEGNKTLINDGKKLCATTLPGVAIYEPPSTLPIYTDNLHFWNNAAISMGNDVLEIAKGMGLGL